MLSFLFMEKRKEEEKTVFALTILFSIVYVLRDMGINKNAKNSFTSPKNSFLFGF